MEEMNNFEEQEVLKSAQLNDVIRKKYYRDQQPPKFAEDDKAKWRDHLFPHGEASLLSEDYENGKLTPEQREVIEKEIDPDQVEWKRVSDVAKGDLHLLEHSDTESTESYLLSSLEALTKFPNLIYKKSLTKDYSHGVYEVLLFIDGDWQIVLIDDYFPYEKGTDNLKFTRMKRNELWKILLMKAWAKVNGGYANIFLGEISDSKQKKCFESIITINNNNFDDDSKRKVLSNKEQKEKSFKELSTLEKAESIDQNMNIFLQSINNNERNNKKGDSKFEEKCGMFIEKWKYNLQQSINTTNNNTSKSISYVFQKRISKELKKFGEPGDDLYTISMYKEKMQHSDKITCLISFKCDGIVFIASGGTDFSVKVWDPITGQKLMSFDEHTNWINCLINIQSEGKNLIASASDDKTIRLWDVDSKECVGVLEGHTDYIHGLINIQTEGRNLIASGSRDTTIILWDVDSKECVGVMKGHTDIIYCLINIQSEGRNLIASASGDKTIRLWDVDSKECVGVLEGHEDAISCLINIQNERRNLIASASDDKTIRLWDVDSKECVGLLKGHEDEIWHLINIQSEGRNLIASGSRDKTIRLWDVDSKKCVGVLEGHEDAITCLINIQSEGRNLIASGSYDTTIRLWDVDSKECVGELEGHTDKITYLNNIQSEGRNLIASGSWDKTIRLWDVDVRGFNDKDYEICKIYAYEHKGSLFLVIGYTEGLIHVWKYNNNKCLLIANFKVHTDKIRCLINIQSDGRNLIASGSWQEVRLWDVDRKECLGVLKGHTHWILCLINFQSEGRNLIASGSGDGDETVRLWDVDSKKCVGLLEGHIREITSLINIQSEGRNLIASGSKDKTIRLWDVDSKKCVGVLEGHTDKIRCLINIQSEGRNLIASGSGYYDKTIRLWDVDSQECVGVLEGHISLITSLINIQSEGRNLIASGSGSGYGDKTIRLWDVDSKKCVGVLEGHTDYISCLINIQSEGRNLIASGSEEKDKTIRLWNVVSQECVGVLEGHEDIIFCLINIQTEGRNLIASGSGGGGANGIGSGDKTIRLWDVDSKECVGYLNAFTGWEDCSKNNLIEKKKSIISGSEDKTVRLWNVVVRDCFNDKEYKISKLYAYEHKGSIFLVIGYEKGFINVWKYFNNNCLFIAYFKGHIRGITSLINFQSEGRNLIASGSGDGDKTVRLWDVDSKECVGVLEGHKDRIWCLINIQSEGRNLIASGSEDITIRLWNVDSQECLGVLKGHTGGINCLINIQTERRNLIASGSDDKTIRLWDVDSQECIFTIKKNYGISSQNLIHANSNIIYNDDSKIKVWNIMSKECLKEMPVNSDITCMINIATEGKTLILFSCGDETLRLWNVDTGEEVKTILQVNVKSLAFSDWGKKRMIIVGLLRSFKILDGDSFQCIQEIMKKEEQLIEVICPSKLNEGKLLLISRSNKDVVRITLLCNFKTFKTFKGHKNYICSGPLFSS